MSAADQPELMDCDWLHLEEEAVLLCVRAERTRREHDRLREVLGTAGVRWSDIWRVASEQQVLPLVARTIQSRALSGVLAEEVLQQARAIRLDTAAYNLACHSELLNVSNALHTRGIPVVPLKGTHLAQRLFGGLDARRVGDIDILVPEERLEDARAAVRARGYSPEAHVSPGVDEHSFHGIPFVRQGAAHAFKLELHWKLTDPRFATIDYAGLWRRTLAGADDRSPLRPLPSEETLVYLAMHLAKHHYGVLRLLVDIDRLARCESAMVDWSRVVATTQAWSAAGLVFFALHHAQVLLGTPVPAWVLRQLRPSVWRQTFVDLLVGPRALLRPQSAQHLQYNRFRLAYCAMLYPAPRALAAYVCYLLAPVGPRQPTRVHTLGSAADKMTRGLAWTGLVVASSVAGRVQSDTWRRVRA
jgi:hypothetical protein